MPSARFAAAALKGATAADAVMAEAWTLQPQAKPSANEAPVPDPTRWGGTIAGTFVDPQAKPEMPNSYDRRETRRPGTESGHPRVLVSPAALAAMQAEASVAVLPADIQKDDVLVRQADGIAWRVATAFPMAGGTLKLGINMLGATSRT